MDEVASLPAVLLSIVIPTYNYAARLPRALDSVVSQLVPDCELVVVDDGSTDDTRAVLERYERKYPKVLRWHSQPNAGAARARNEGLRLSRGRFILYLDADDELLPGALPLILESLHRQPQATVVIGGHVSASPDGRERTHRPRVELSADPVERVTDYLLRKRIRIGHGSMIASRTLFEQCPYAEHFRGREDIPVFAHLIAFGVIAVIPQALARVHKHADSLRHTVPTEEEGIALVDAVFSGLPSSCQHLRSRYAAQRYLSMFRAALQVGNKALARDYFFKAVRLDLRQTMRLSYLRKAVRLLW